MIYVELTTKLMGNIYIYIYILVLTCIIKKMMADWLLQRVIHLPDYEQVQHEEGFNWVLGKSQVGCDADGYGY